MRRPWAIWTIFSLAVLLAASATAALSLFTVALDRRNSEAQARAAHEENIRLALWRLDSNMLAFMANENTRPPVDYAVSLPSLPESNKAGVASPLRSQIPFVRLHFHIDHRLQLFSPQVLTPGGDETLAADWELFQTLAGKREWVELARRLCAAPGAEGGIAPLPEVTIAQAKGKLEQATQSRAPASRPLPGRTPSQPAAEEQTQADIQQAAAIPEKPVSPENRLLLGGQRLMSDNEFEKRQEYLSNLTLLNQWNRSPSGTSESLTGAMRAVWHRGELFLLRRVRTPAGEAVQGCWIDWPLFQNWLLEGIQDLLPHADLQVPAAGFSEVASSLQLPRSGGAGYTLAAAPLQLVPGILVLSEAPVSAPLQWVLILGWSGLLLAIVATGGLLLATQRLSERRATFASAVTHELRTPLTTFRLYTQMLLEDMVPDAERRREYLQTLLTESGRLGHLVENVLAYARIEKGRHSRLQVIEAGVLLRQAMERPLQRLESAGGTCRMKQDPAVLTARVRTDPSAVEQILFNLIDNACKYAIRGQGAMTLTATTEAGRLNLRICDEGPGLSAEARKTLFRPFSKSAVAAAETAPGVGLGLSLCKRLAGHVGAKLKHVPTPRGTCFELSLPLAE